MSFIEELSDPANWPMVALFMWMMLTSLRGAIGRWKETHIRRTMAGVAFGVIALKIATRLDFQLYERWEMMLFAYFGTVFLIDSCRAKD
jgi:hypothetical protein